MLRQEENELLTRVGPGTPMGELIRRYWVPALLSEEIGEPDSAPVRVKILGERLVAFRDTEGRVGLLDEFCPHRRTSLVYGRNEESGLRCIYHGWKFDVDGNIVETPCEPPESTFRYRLSIRAYPIREMGGVIWSYLGPPEKMPPFRVFEWMTLPDNNCHAVKIWEEANYLQALEGGVDSSHLSWLHRIFKGAGEMSLSAFDGAPRLEIEETPYGYRYAAIRKTANPAERFVRITPFILPFHTIVPFAKDQPRNFHAWVPIDDENVWVYFMHYGRNHEIDPVAHKEPYELDAEYRRRRTLRNQHLQDREMMRTTNFSGIPHIPTQDHAVQEAMGPIVDRSLEHLGSSDTSVIHLRQLLLRVVGDLMEGKDPPGLNEPIPWELIDSESIVVPADMPWQQLGALPQNATVAG
ncbi:MAG: (2Fe-2S)-binding protein [Chloroflexi bacterium]|nr:(2Fe-2S)-binding protein [Chloroflexota bacterium]